MAQWQSTGGSSQREVSWVRLLATAGFFTFLYFHLITSKFIYLFKVLVTKHQTSKHVFCVWQKQFKQISLTTYLQVIHLTVSDSYSYFFSLTQSISGQPPSPPQNPGYCVQYYGPHNVTVTVQWGYPEFDGGVPVDNYTISGTNIMTATSQINETTLTLPYNARQTIEVAATNCIGTSRTATFTYFESRL